MSHAVNSIGEPIDLEHVIHIQRSDKHVEVEFGGEVITESHNTLVLKEAHCADVYYFPIVDVRMEILKSGEIVSESTGCRLMIAGPEHTESCTCTQSYKGRVVYTKCSP